MKPPTNINNPVDEWEFIDKNISEFVGLVFDVDTDVFTDGTKQRYQNLKSALQSHIEQMIVEANYLSHFNYDDWDIGDDDKLRVGDIIACDHQRPHDGYEQLFYGTIVEHHDNGIPVVLCNVDPEDPNNSGDYEDIQEMYMGGWTFSRHATLTKEKL